MKSGFGYPAKGINNEAFTSRKVTRTVENLLTFKAFQHQEHINKSHMHSTVNVVNFLKKCTFYFLWGVLLKIPKICNFCISEVQRAKSSQTQSLPHLFFFVLVFLCRHMYVQTLLHI